MRNSFTTFVNQLGMPPDEIGEPFSLTIGPRIIKRTIEQLQKLLLNGIHLPALRGQSGFNAFGQNSADAI